MKRILILLALLLGNTKVHASDKGPRHVRICIQYFSLPLRGLNELLADETVSDAVLHDKVMALSKEGKVKLMDSNMILCRSGQKAINESIREEIYPAEYPPNDGMDPPQPLLLKPCVRSFDALFRSTFETRNTGMTLEVEAIIESPTLVSVRLVPELITLNGLTTWMEHSDHWGKADIRMPVFETWRANTTMILKPGTFALVSSITPKRALPVPFLENRILLFVRADLLGTALE